MIDNKPIISVIMGIFNCESTLNEAIDSIKKQTFENWELIMCDDCSTDKTLELAQQAAQSDSRITVITNNKNLTLAPTLNRCLAVAKGKYIARMDGDDTCSPIRFEKELEFLQTHDEFAVVSTKMNMFDNDGIFRTTNVNSFPNVKNLIVGPPFCHAGCMMRKSVIDSLGGYSTDSSVQRVEDYDLWYRMYKAGFKGANLQEALYNMRDDRKAVKRRKMKYRVNSYNIRKKIIKTFRLSPKYYAYALRPILIGLIPTFAYKMIHKGRKC